MALVLNEEQRLLQDTAREFLNSNAEVEQLRRLRDNRDELGYDAEVWKQMSELGWASIILPEQYGGLDFGFLGLGAVIEETGHTLTASPLITSAVIGASAILLGGSESQKETLLPEIAAGRLTTALALEESNHHNPAGVAMQAVKDGDDYVLEAAMDQPGYSLSPNFAMGCAQRSGPGSPPECLPKKFSSSTAGSPV